MFEKNSSRKGNISRSESIIKQPILRDASSIEKEKSFKMKNEISVHNRENNGQRNL